jgi:hypothetical protein
LTICRAHAPDNRSKFLVTVVRDVSGKRSNERTQYCREIVLQMQAQFMNPIRTYFHGARRGRTKNEIKLCGHKSVRIAGVEHGPGRMCQSRRSGRHVRIEPNKPVPCPTCTRGGREHSISLKTRTVETSSDWRQEGIAAN